MAFKNTRKHQSICEPGSVCETYVPSPKAIKKLARKIARKWSDEVRAERRGGRIYDSSMPNIHPSIVCPTCGNVTGHIIKGVPQDCLECALDNRAIKEGRGGGDLAHQYCNGHPDAADRQYHGGSLNRSDNPVWWEGVGDAFVA